jgi:O-antigen ligase
VVPRVTNGNQVLTGVTLAGRLTLRRISAVLLLIVLLLLQVPWFLTGTGALSLMAGAAYLAVALIRPHESLLIFAALSPCSTLAAEMLGVPGRGWHLLAQMALGTATGILLQSPEAPPRTRLAPFASLLAFIATTSALLQFCELLFWASSVFECVQSIAHTFVTAKPWPPMKAAWIVAAGVTGGWATERILRDRPALLRPTLAVALAGHAYVAALNVWPLARSALRGPEFLTAFLALLRVSRLSFQTDFNAAGSAFALAFVASWGLRGSSWQRLAVVAIQVTLAAGLWVTGSRAAMAAAAVTPLLILGWTAGRRWRRARITGVASVAATAAFLMIFVAWYPMTRNDSFRSTLASRWVLMSAGLQMFETAPVFGVGVSHFYDLSWNYIGEHAHHVGARQENAHNNFIQVLAEQGAVGLAILLMAIGLLLWQAFRAEQTTSSPTRVWLAGGLIAAILTWLTGHPLLTAEFTTVFWLFCGLLAATLPPPVPSEGLRRLTMLGAIGLVACLPFRVVDARNHANLEHRGFDLSSWLFDDEQRYREGGRAFSLFLRADGQPQLLPVRRAPGAPQLVLALSRGGRLLSSVRLGDDAWHDIQVTLSPGGRDYELVEASVTPLDAAPADRPAWVRVGRAR